ncbi:hypothetical protein [Rhizobium phage RHph_X2_26]|nr:hypothetical protein [Rhizobium phage RHph_X2_26]
MPDFDAEFELKNYVLDTLKANTRVNDMTGGRIFATLPEGDEPILSPYIALGPWVSTGDDAECFEGYLTQISIDCYSYGPNEHGSGALVEKLASAVRRALVSDNVDLLSDNATASISNRVTRYFKENGGALQRANVGLEALLDIG